MIILVSAWESSQSHIVDGYAAVVEISLMEALNWTCYFKPGYQALNRRWLLITRARGAWSQTAEAFQDLAAQEMSRSVTLCALARLQCQSQRPAPPLEHDRKHNASVWRADADLCLTSQEVSNAAGSKVTGRALPSSWLSSLQPWLHFCGFVMKINTLSKPLARCHILFSWTEPLQRPLIRVRPLYRFANISGWYMKTAPP